MEKKKLTKLKLNSLSTLSDSEMKNVMGGAEISLFLSCSTTCAAGNVIADDNCRSCNGSISGERVVCDKGGSVVTTECKTITGAAPEEGGTGCECPP